MNSLNHNLNSNLSKKTGVLIIGSHGAVATTVIAGVALMKKGLVPRQGMITEGPLGKALDLVALDDLVFSGWDMREDTAYEAAIGHDVIKRHLLDQVKEELQSFHAWPAAVSSNFLYSMTGKNVVIASSFREELEYLKKDILSFQAKHDINRVVMVNLTSTEKYCEIENVHQDLKAFEKGLDENDPRISPAMKYLYVACKMGIAHVNFTPSLTKIPALERLAQECGVPICGEDGKTGQTLLKTVLAPAFNIRQLQVDGWYSTNILGNNDGLVLNDPESNKTKVTSKQNVLDSILGYKVDDHQVHIHYYRPRGDAKEAWDNIDISGFLGEKMQLKVDFLCKDSILAAPLILDLVRLSDFAKRSGERGIQKQFSMFLKPRTMHLANFQNMIFSSNTRCFCSGLKVIRKLKNSRPLFLKQRLCHAPFSTLWRETYFNHRATHPLAHSNFRGSAKGSSSTRARDFIRAFCS